MTLGIAGDAALGSGGGKEKPEETSNRQEGTPTETPGERTPIKTAQPSRTPDDAQIPKVIQIVRFMSGISKKAVS